MNLLTTTIFALGMLAAFWSGFYVGYLKREDRKPPIPLISSLDEFSEEIVDRVKDSIGKQKEVEPQGFYD
jgi:hypothetical protein